MNTTAWRKHIEPALAESVQAAEKKLTSQAAMQEWLQDASYQAAAGIRSGSGGSDMDAYHELSNEFEQTFEPLRIAVRELTHGCGQAVLDWQPRDPQQTTVRISFGYEFRVHLYEHMDAVSQASAEGFLTRLSSFLPKGAPFPKKPHRVGGVVSAADACLGVRVVERVTGEENREKYVLLYGEHIQKEDDIAYAAAPRYLAAALSDASD